MPKLNIFLIRKAYKISQQELACLLVTTRSAIAMAEQGRRVLSEESLILLNALYENITDKADADSPEATMKQNELLRLKENWQSRYEKVNIDIGIAQLKLLKMDQNYKNLTGGHWNLGNALRLFPENGPQAKLLRSKHYKIESKNIACSAIARLELEVTIEMLMAEARILSDLISKCETHQL